MNANSAQTGYMSNYDASDTTVVADTTPMFGFQSGTFVSWEWANDMSSTDVDSQGTGVSSTNNKKNGSVTINLSQESPCNVKMTELANTRVRFPIDVRSANEHIWGEHCTITRIPAGENGDTATVRAWAISAPELKYERLDSMPS